MDRSIIKAIKALIDSIRQFLLDFFCLGLGKLDCEWGMLTQEEMSQLLHAVSSEFFEVSYPDPMDGQVTKTFYVGDRTAPSYTFTEKFKPWSGAKFNLVER